MGVTSGMYFFYATSQRNLRLMKASLVGLLDYKSLTTPGFVPRMRKNETTNFRPNLDAGLLGPRDPNPVIRPGPLELESHMQSPRQRRL